MLYAQVTQTDGASQRNVLLTRQLATLLPQAAGAKPVDLQHGQNREPRGTTTFAAKEIAAALALLGLPANSPLSALGVEILPGPFRATGRVDVVVGASVGCGGRRRRGPVGDGARAAPHSAHVTPGRGACDLLTVDER